jgi:hypothetical protein
VTGGTGYLGSLLAGWLATQRVGAIDLVARSARAGRGLAPLLGGGGASAALTPLRLVQCDAALSADVAALYAPSSSSPLLPVEAVFHAGGVLADGTLQQLGLGSVRRVAAAKQGALARLLPLQGVQPGGALVLFSSVAALLGSPGQAPYSAANAALDAAAAALNGSGVAAVSVQWGAWAGAGMAARDPQTAARLARLGMGLIAPQQGLAALEGALAALGGGGGGGPATPPPQAVVAAVPFKWAAFLASRQPLPGFFSEFAPHLPAPRDAAQRAAARRGSRRWRGAGAPSGGGAAAPALEAVVGEAAASVLGRRVAADEPLVAAGLDSLGGVELRNLLQVRFGCRLCIAKGLFLLTSMPALPWDQPRR